TELTFKKTSVIHGIRFPSYNNFDIEKVCPKICLVAVTCYGIKMQFPDVSPETASGIVSLKTTLEDGGRELQASRSRPIVRKSSKRSSSLLIPHVMRK
ncbi:hypothetical protein L9F63_015062, partial [Diploptera punctata]